MTMRNGPDFSSAAHPALIAAAIIVAVAVTRLPTLGFPLTETHAFRQTQTAFPAVIYASEGIDLLRPQVPVFGPPWVLPFEFPIVQALGAVLIRAGLTPEVAMRSLALMAFLASAWLLWTIVRGRVSTRAGLIALIVFVASPFALVYSRASLIEYPAVLGALVFVYAALEWQDTGRRRWLAVAFVAGGLAALVKITTAVFWLAPVLLLRRWPPVLVAAAAGAVGLGWTLYAEAVKGANLYSAFLGDGRLAGWNFGGDRLSIETWHQVLGPILLDASMLLAPFAIFVALRPERRFWAWMGIALLGPLLLFTNLYAVHDYYAAAIAPALAALIGGGLDQGIARIRLLAPVAVAAGATALLITFPTWFAAYDGRDPNGVLERAAEIRASTAHDDLVVTIGDDWSPAFFFYADRRGFALQRDVLRIYDLPVPDGTLVK